MIKATGKGPTGNPTLFVGLSFGNLDRFRAKPLDTFIRIDGAELGLSHDVLIFSGRTEEEMAADMMEKAAMSVWWCDACKAAFAPGPVCPRCGKAGGVAQPVA